MTMRIRSWIAAAVGAAMLAGCAVQDVHRPDALATDTEWALLPMVNYAQTPQAGQRAEAILSTLLHKHGVGHLRRYPAQRDGGLPELNDEHRLDTAMAWARDAGMLYGVRGSVEEWQYKTGLDGEPVVGLTVQVVDVPSGRVLWSASGARSGWGYGTLSGTAQELLRDLVAELPLRR